MIFLKFLILAIAIICSLYIACWLIATIAQSAILTKNNRTGKSSISFYWFVVASLAWSAFAVFF